MLYMDQEQELPANRYIHLITSWFDKQNYIQKLDLVP